MKYLILDEEEEQIIKDFEEGKLVRVKDFAKQKKLFKEYASVEKNTTSNSEFTG